MYKREVIKAPTSFKLLCKILKLMFKYTKVEVLDKTCLRCGRTNRVILNATVRYNDCTPIPKSWEGVKVETKTFYSEEERRDFINKNCISDYWLRDYDKRHCQKGHIWEVICKC